MAGLEPASREAVDFESTEFTNFSTSAKKFVIIVIAYLKVNNFLPIWLTNGTLVA